MDAAADGHDADGPGAQVKLKRLFKFYAAGEDAKNDLDAGSIDTGEFLFMAKQCKFPQCGLSFSQALQVFVQCNEEEMENFVAGELDEDLGDALQMEYEEFELSFLKFTSLMLTLPQKSSKKRTFTQVLDEFILKIFQEAPPRLRL